MMVRTLLTLSRRLASSRTHLGDFPLDLDKVSLSNSNGHDHVVHRAVYRCIYY